MSISALATQATELLNYYSSIRSDIDARISALNAADPKSVRTICVHSVDGSDESGTGTQIDPFRSLDHAIQLQALEVMPATTIIYLLDAGPHVLTTIEWCYGLVFLATYPDLMTNSHVYATITQAAQQASNRASDNHMPRILTGPASALWIRDINVNTATTKLYEESSGLFGGSVAGGVGEIVFETTAFGVNAVGNAPRITINATDLVGADAPNAVTIRGCDVGAAVAATGGLINVGAVATTFNAINLALDPGLDIRGLVKGVTYHAGAATDIPRNIFSNVALPPV